MPNRFGKLFLIFSLLLALVLPFAGSYIRWNGLPPGFGIFPAQQVMDEPGFNLIYFIIMAIICAVMLAFILFPNWFGFKKHENDVIYEVIKGNRTGFPFWFLPGIIITIFFWIAMWGQFSWLGSLVHFTFVPLWWGFILVIDGIVYKRTGGLSLISTKPKTMFLVIIASVVGWFIFEYFNYFVIENWYYPINNIFSPMGYFIWYTLAYTTVWPAIFEWYNLLNTFEFMRKRYSDGPKLDFSQSTKFIIFITGLLLSFGFGFFPHLLFFGLWVAPLIVLSSALLIGNYWTPFAPITKGNWTPFTLMALSSLCNALFWEGWNFWSPPNNPNFWKYDIPYVGVFHIFEMPALGFFGYLPFGILCWVWWLFVAYIFNLSPDINVVTKESKNQENY
jgi:hypothetical protein